MKLSLRAKATLLSGVLVVAGLAVVGWLQHRQLEQDVRGVVEAQLDTLGESIADDLSAKLEMHLAVVAHAATTVDAALLADPARRQDHVGRLAATRALFDGSSLIDPEGRVIASDPPLPAGLQLSLADRPYFQRLRAAGRPLISEPIVSRTGRGPVVLMLAPVRAADGGVIGYASASLLLERSSMLGAMRQAPLGRTGHIEVVTGGAQPVYVLHPDSGRLLRPAPALARGDLDIDYLSVSKPLRGVDWSLRLVLPRWEVDAPLAEARRRLVAETALLAAASALAAWFAMTWLLRPLGTLHATIERLRRQPDSPEHVDTASSDERGDLARSFEALMRDMRLRQAEVQAIAERSPLGMFRAGTDGRLVYANAAYLAIHGLAADDAADGWLRLVPAEGRAAAWAEWTAAVRSAEPYYVQRELRHPDGRPLQLVVRSAPVVVDGEVAGHVGTVFDATERNAQERAQRVLATIFDTTPDFVVQADRDGRVTYANPAARRLHDLAADAPIAGVDFATFLPASTQRRFAEEILPAVRAHGHWLGETRILDARGREVPVSHLVIAHRDAQGRIEHFSAVMRDISQAVAAREESERAAATLQSVAELMPADLTVVGADMRFRFVNSAFARRVGRTPAQILGRHAAEVLDAAAYAASLPHAQRALAGESVSFEREQAGPAGTRVFAVSYLPVRLPSGAADGLVGVAQDITGHRREALHWRDRSHRDALTGLHNRAGFEAGLAAQLEAGHGARLALLYLDLDRFKPVNDQHGHAAGDHVLCTVARRLERMVRPTDLVARLGGDEFALLLPDMPDAAAAHAVAAKIARALPQPIALDDGAVVEVGASVGVVHGVVAGEDAAAFVARADRLMYEAKSAQAGR